MLSALRNAVLAATAGLCLTAAANAASTTYDITFTDSVGSTIPAGSGRYKTSANGYAPALRSSAAERPSDYPHHAHCIAGGTTALPPAWGELTGFGWARLSSRSHAQRSPAAQSSRTRDRKLGRWDWHPLTANSVTSRMLRRGGMTMPPDRLQ
jgi:hypothetical protein